MRLKKLTLQGYKTFASKTEFIFDDGITAIVGPNGSGKSNVADAVRWVLGEQSYGTLRGKRTTDMIFAGSQKRPRSGMAQAILTLDNSDGWLPIDYTEVEIGRRAHRSGENEYLLNGQKVRLKDIADLLATSGLAQRTYTIIGQGLIDQALSLRAEERRALFEEAAGIHHYKSRRAETLRRLEETRHNLERVHDILNEIGPRMSSLKRQAIRAQNYEQVAQDLHHLLRIWYGFKWEQTKGNMRLARERAATAEKAWQETRKEYLIQQDKIDVIRRRINELQDKTAVTRQQREDVREQLEKARRQVAILSERQQSLQRQLADIEQDLPDVEKQLAAAQADLASATSELEAAQASLNENQTELRQFNATFQTQQGEINHWQKKLSQVVQDQRTSQNKLAQAEGQLSQLQERLKEQAQPAADSPSRRNRAVGKTQSTINGRSPICPKQKRRTAPKTRRSANSAPGNRARTQNLAPRPQRRAENTQQAPPRPCPPGSPRRHARPDAPKREQSQRQCPQFRPTRQPHHHSRGTRSRASLPRSPTVSPPSFCPTRPTCGSSSRTTRNKR